MDCLRADPWEGSNQRCFGAVVVSVRARASLGGSVCGCFAGPGSPCPSLKGPKRSRSPKLDRDRESCRRARHDRDSPGCERRGRERRGRTRERSRSRRASHLGTAPKGAAPIPPRRNCTRAGCSKTTSGEWAACQRLMAVHATGEQGQAERDALWEEACRLWPDDPASQGTAVRKRTRAKAADHLIASPKPANPPQRRDAEGSPSPAVAPTASSSATERLRMYEAFCEATKSMMKGT